MTLLISLKYTKFLLESQRNFVSSKQGKTILAGGRDRRRQKQNWRKLILRWKWLLGRQRGQSEPKTPRTTTKAIRGWSPESKFKISHILSPINATQGTRTRNSIRLQTGEGFLIMLKISTFPHSLEFYGFQLIQARSCHEDTSSFMVRSDSLHWWNCI